uniref:Uncharacterized protein n=1 Tax=Amphimedon queenslandica TaxID=400682 RepID=A0A1X7TIK1_AMPQE
MATSSVHSVQDLTEFFEELKVEGRQAKYVSNSEKQSELRKLKAEIDINTIKCSITKQQGRLGEELKEQKLQKQHDLQHHVRISCYFQQLLSEWKKKEEYADNLTATNIVKSKLLTQESREETNDEIFEDVVSDLDDIKKYEASKKLHTMKKAVKLITNAIKEQEKVKNKVVEVRTALHTTLIVTRLQEHKSLDGLQHLISILPADSMYYNQEATKAIDQIHKHARMQAITTGNTEAIPPVKGAESSSDDPWERKIQIDKECDESFESAKNQVAEAKKLTSGTKKEIKGVALMQKVADNIQGDFQPEVIALLNEELTPKNSSSLSEESYKRMY